jgi:hypothetical protein
MVSKVTGSYKASNGDWDGMHSFESRQSDGFGGKMHTKVNEALKEFYTTKKLNPYVSSIKITMDKNNYTVNWEVTIDESPDGVAYVGLTSRGGAGNAAGAKGSINRAYNQALAKKMALPSEVDKSTVAVDILDFYFKFSNSGAVRQIFILYTNPGKYANLPKSANLTNGKVGNPIGKDVGPENNGKLIQTSTVPPGTTNTVSVNNAAQTNTNPDASKITGPVDGTSIPTGGTFDFLEIKDSNKNKIGFISFPPRRSGSVPVLMIYPRKENITNDETFKLGREEVIGKFSGIKMANKFLSWTNPQGQTADKNWIPDVTKVIGNLSKSPLESWFSKWCIVFANEPDTDFNQLTNQITEQLDSRAMTISSLNLTIFADSGYIDNSIMASLSESQPFPIKTLMLLEIYPSMEILKISKRIKSEGGQVYNVYDSQNFKTNITKNIIAGLSYSGPPFEETSIVSGSTTQSQLSNPILFFDSVTGATISATQYNTLFKTSASSYSPFPLIPYSSLPLTLIPGSSPSQFTQSTSVKFLNDLAFTYTTLAQDLLKEGVYVYDLSKDPVQNFTPIGLSAGWPEVKLINGNYILTTPTVAPEPVVAGSTASVPIPDINVKYVLSHLQQTNIDELPQLGFQIFYSDIEKIIGQSTQAGSASQPKVLLSGQFTFDVRRKGYFINDQLGEFKIIDKQEIDLFIRSNEEVYEEGPSPEYVEEEFAGEQEAPENIPEVEIGYVEDEGSSQVNDTSTSSQVNDTSTSSTPTVSGSRVKLPTGPSAYSHNSTQGYNLVDSKWYGDLLSSAIAHLDHPTFDIPGTEKGALGCASWVSMVFYRAFGVHMRDGSVVKKLPKSISDFGSEGTLALGSWFGKNPGMWDKIPWKEGKPGDVINTERGSKAGHVGIVMNTINKDGSYDVASNSSKGFGSKGDPQGCGKLNYSIKKWQSVTDRNPLRTFCWRYKGPKLTQGQTT